jgi:hypothetical protein
MKRLRAVTILVFAIAISGVSHVSGQSYPGDRGSFLIGGGAALTSSKITWVGMSGEKYSNDQTRLSVTPSLQYFLIPGLALGGQVSMGWHSDGLWHLGGGPALTYFFFKGERNWNLYLSGSLERGKTWNSEDGEDQAFSSYRGAGGTLFMVSSGVGIHTEVFYEFWKESDSFRDLETNEFGLSVGISVFVY